MAHRRVILCHQCGRVSSSDGLHCDRCLQMGIIPDGSTYADEYRIESFIDRGGMGTIYKAVHTKSGRAVAIKEFFDEKDWSDQKRRLFLDSLKREAEILRDLQIVRAVPLLERVFTEWNGRHFFVMEFIGGGDLQTALERRGQPFPWKVVVKWGIRICEVFEVLHGRRPPVVYRDLKPENIALRGPQVGEDIVLLDFGTARTTRSGRKKTRGIGSEGYSPREQRSGKPEPRSDLYALAVSMHQLLTNRDPIRNPPPFSPAGQLNPRVPQWLSDLLAINLSEKPRERYESAARVKQDLKDHRVTATIRCSKCGRENERSLVYCERCGATVLSTPRQCPHCTEFIPYNARYCPRCGVEIG